jgi:hypothetical protein
LFSEQIYHPHSPQKCFSLSVITTQSLTSATAAMIASGPLRGRPQAVLSVMSLP